MYHSGHGYAALRKGRVSVPHATYFVTLCVVECRKRVYARSSASGLPTCLEFIRQVLAEMEQDNAIQLRAGVVMPDHVHLLFRLGEKLTFSQVMGRFKAKTRRPIFEYGLLWQQNVFEHRLRPDEKVLPVLHYIFMNPYRKGLTGMDERWPGFFCGEDDWQWFQAHLQHELPYPEWLN